MPLPTPRGGESQSQFVSRCMGSDVMNREYPDNKQRAAVCYSQWRRREEEKLHKIVEEKDPVRLQRDRYLGGGEEQQLPDAIIAGAAGQYAEHESTGPPGGPRSRGGWEAEDDLDELFPVK